MLVSDVVDKFVDWCAHNRAPKTVRLYRGRLKSFRTKFADRELKSLKPLDIDEWLREADLRADGTELAPDTRRANRTSFKRLQQWTRENKLLKKKIIKKLEMPRGRRRERIPTDAEIARILELGSPEFGRAYRALLQTGARPNEICRATFEHIETTESGQQVIVLKEHKTAKKTGKPRRIPIGQKLAPIIAAATAGRTEGHLFLSPRGKPWTPANLSTTFKKARRKAGFDDSLVLYCARHHKGTTVCREHGIHAAALVLGHTQLSTTQRYDHQNDEDVARYQDG